MSKAVRVIAAGLGAGVAFAVMDALLNANPIAQRLYASYRPIARDSLNTPLGLTFDLLSCAGMSFVFVALLPSLGRTRWGRGLAFGLLAWFFRVWMAAAAQAVVFRMPLEAFLYCLFAGMGEMLALGLLLSWTLPRPVPRNA